MTSSVGSTCEPPIGCRPLSLRPTASSRLAWARVRVRVRVRIRIRVRVRVRVRV